MQQYVITILVSVIGAVLVWVIQLLLKRISELESRKREEEETSRRAVVQAVVQLLRIQLCEYHDKYMHEESIPTYAYDNWVRMFREYKALGGNGMVTHMNEDIETLKMQNN